MTRPQIESQILGLSLDERYRLAEFLLQNLEEGLQPIPEWHRQILADRLRAEEQDPEAGSSWQEAKARILDSLP